MFDMKRLIADLTPLNRVVCSSDFDVTIAYMQNILPFNEHTYSAQEDYNGWVIPPKWDIKSAGIYFEGRCSVRQPSWRYSSLASGNPIWSLPWPTH